MPTYTRDQQLLVTKYLWTLRDLRHAIRQHELALSSGKAAEVKRQFARINQLREFKEMCGERLRENGIDPLRLR